MKKTILFFLLSAASIIGAAEYRQECTIGHYSNKENAIVGIADFSRLAKERGGVEIEDVRFVKEGSLLEAVVCCLVDEPDISITAVEAGMKDLHQDQNRYFSSLSPALRVPPNETVDYSVTSELICKPVKVTIPRYSRSQNWRIGARNVLRGGISVVDCLPDGATNRDWVEMVSVRFQPYENVRNPAVTAKKLAELLMRGLKAEHSKQGIAFKTHKNRKGDMVYEWWLAEGAEAPSHEIVRIVTNKVGIFFVSYLNKGASLTEEQWHDWRHSVANAEIE